MLTVKILLQIGKVFRLSYNAVNIITWYMLLPLVWIAILDYKLHQIMFVPAWIIFCVGVIVQQRKQFNKFCYSFFKLSQQFILLFGNYYLWSVLICLVLPLIITTLLIICQTLINIPKESILWFCTIYSLRYYATRSRQVNTNATIFATLTVTFNMKLFMRQKYQLIPSTSQDLQDYLLIFDDLAEVHSDSLRTLPNLQYSVPQVPSYRRI